MTDDEAFKILDAKELISAAMREVDLKKLDFVKLFEACEVLVKAGLVSGNVMGRLQALKVLQNEAGNILTPSGWSETKTVETAKKAVDRFLAVLRTHRSGVESSGFNTPFVPQQIVSEICEVLRFLMGEKVFYKTEEVREGVLELYTFVLDSFRHRLKEAPVPPPPDIVENMYQLLGNMEELGGEYKEDALLRKVLDSLSAGVPGGSGHLPGKATQEQVIEDVLRNAEKMLNDGKFETCIYIELQKHPEKNIDQICSMLVLPHEPLKGPEQFNDFAQTCREAAIRFGGYASAVLSLAKVHMDGATGALVTIEYEGEEVLTFCAEVPADGEISKFRKIQGVFLDDTMSNILPKKETLH